MPKMMETGILNLDSRSSSEKLGFFGSIKGFLTKCYKPTPPKHLKNFTKDPMIYDIDHFLLGEKFLQKMSKKKVFSRKQLKSLVREKNMYEILPTLLSQFYFTEDWNFQSRLLDLIAKCFTQRKSLIDNI